MLTNTKKNIYAKHKLTKGGCYCTAAPMIWIYAAAAPSMTAPAWSETRAFARARLYKHLMPAGGIRFDHIGRHAHPVFVFLDLLDCADLHKLPSGLRVGVDGIFVFGGF